MANRAWNANKGLHKEPSQYHPHHDFLVKSDTCYSVIEYRAGFSTCDQVYGRHKQLLMALDRV